MGTMKISIDSILTKSKEGVQFAALSVKNKYLFLGKSLRKTNGTDKLGKVIVNALDIFILAFSSYAPLGALRGRIKNLRDFCGSLSSIHSIKDWVCPKEENKRFWQLKETSNWAICSKVFLTGAHFVETASFMDSVKIISFANISAEMGRLPVLKIPANSSFPLMSIIKDICYFFSSLFGLVDNYIIISKSHVETKEYDLKRRKWQDKANEWRSAFDDNNDTGGTKTREGLKALYQAKIDTAELRRQELIWECLSLQEDIEKTIPKSKFLKSVLNNPDLLMKELAKHLGEIKVLIADFQKKQKTPVEARAFLEISQKMETIIEGMKQLEKLARNQDVKTEILVKLREDFNAIRVDMYNLNAQVYTSATEKPHASAAPLTQVQIYEKNYQNRLNQFLRIEQDLEKWNSYITEIGLYKKASCEEYVNRCERTKCRKWEVKAANCREKRIKHWHIAADLAAKLALSVFGLTCAAFGFKGVITDSIQLVLGSIATFTSFKLFAVDEEFQQLSEPQAQELSFTIKVTQTLASAHNITAHVENGASTEMVSSLTGSVPFGISSVTGSSMLTSSLDLKGNTAKTFEVKVFPGPSSISAQKTQKMASTLSEYLMKIKGKLSAQSTAQTYQSLAATAFKVHQVATKAIA